jgi:hypothetical protein
VRDMKLEERERTHAELQEELAARDRQLSAAVEQLQDEFDRRESEWWAKQLGKQPQAPAA